MSSKLNSAIKTALALSLGATVVACSSGSDDADKYFDDAQIREILEELNSDSTLDEGTYQPLDVSTSTNQDFNAMRSVRFDTSSQIPLYFVSNGGVEPDSRITQGVAELEALLGDVFTDITLVDADVSGYRDASASGNIGDSQAWNTDRERETFFADNGIASGIVISIDTGYWPGSENSDWFCANASTGPYMGAMERVYEPAAYTFAGDFVQWVNLGNGVCSWDKEIVKHEFAHALGFFTHHYEDGVYGKWSVTAETLLKTLYMNLPGTPYSDMIIHRSGE